MCIFIKSINPVAQHNVTLNIKVRETTQKQE